MPPSTVENLNASLPAEAGLAISRAVSAARPRRPFFPPSFSYSRSVLGLERIFENEISICIWRRPSDPQIARYLSGCAFAEALELAERLDSRTPELDVILRHFPATAARGRFAADITALIDVFATLTDARRIGLRLSVTRDAMCPRFHVDHVGLRLLSTWVGAGTEWLEHESVDRRYLGAGGGFAPDETSGLLLPGAQIHRMRAFDVALFKGERFAGNEGRGAVHRSPTVPAAAPWRIVISLDDLG